MLNDQRHSSRVRLAQVVGAAVLAASLLVQTPWPRLGLADEWEDSKAAGGDQADIEQPEAPQPSEEEQAQERAKQKREECVAAIARGLRNHWMSVTGDVSSFEQYVACIKEGAETQLNQISLYAPEDFGDEAFATLIDQYRKALSSQIEGIDAMLGDPETYNKKYLDEGALVRAKVLDELQKSHGLTVDDLYQANLDEALHPNAARAYGLGQAIRLTLPQGDLDVTVEGLDHDARLTAVAKEKGFLPAGRHVGVLLLTVHNESYALDYEGHPYVELNKIVHTCDASFHAFPAMSVSFEYADYTVAEGGYTELPVGETARVAIPYLVDEKLDDALVRVGKKRFVYVKASESRQAETQAQAQSEAPTRVPLVH